MKRRKNQMRTMMLVLFSVLVSSVTIQAQSYQATASNATINVEGTSNIHEWDLKAEKFTIKATI